MRVLSGSLAATFATLVAAFSHLLAGGTAPSGAALALSLALSIPICIALVGPTVSLWRTSVAVGIAQAMFHGLFSGTSYSGTVVVPEHAVHAGTPISLAGLPDGTGSHHSASMWLAHVGAALLTVVALRYVESAILRLRGTARLLVALLTVVISAVPVLGEGRPARVGCAQTVLPRDLALLFSALRHRGPPAISAA
ncbi:hypothetical protein B0I08_101234 [Glaciihabitans tibetensis]|uniref:Uncharacterized protein n=1 Tax=Glaciihabitans tibetensis TaxID=1266600 RepID=A0A2T0VIT8_9MICO|nr:hypothetical protein B0I08_101234 [Glaciihabitans tibetensis]